MILRKYLSTDSKNIYNFNYPPRRFPAYLNTFSGINMYKIIENIMVVFNDTLKIGLELLDEIFVELESLSKFYKITIVEPKFSYREIKKYINWARIFQYFLCLMECFFSHLIRRY